VDRGPARTRAHGRRRRQRVARKRRASIARAPRCAMDASLEDDIFSACIGPGSDDLVSRDLIGRTLSHAIRPLALLQRILFFVHPERVLLTRLAPHLRRLLKQDIKAVRLQLQSSRFNYTLTGVPVTLLCGAPGSWSGLLPMLGLSDEEVRQHQLCFAHRAEGFASLAVVLAKHGSALRTLRVAVETQEEPGTAAAATGAAALLISVLARGYFGQLNSLTLADAGGMRPGGASFLAPLARSSASPLKQLRTLRLSLAGSSARAHLGCLAAFARRGGLQSLRSLTIFGEREDARVEDADIAALLRAILSAPRAPALVLPLSPPVVADVAAPAAAAAAAAPLTPEAAVDAAAEGQRRQGDKEQASRALAVVAAATAPEGFAALPSAAPPAVGLGDAAAVVGMLCEGDVEASVAQPAEEQGQLRPAPPSGTAAAPVAAPVVPRLACCQLTSVDLTGSLAGPATLEVLLELLERLHSHGTPPSCQQVSVQLDGTPAATDEECQAMFGKVQRLLPTRFGA